MNKNTSAHTESIFSIWRGLLHMRTNGGIELPDLNPDILFEF